MSNLDKKITALKDRLSEAAHKFKPITLASSLGAEDMVLTDLILRDKIDISIFTINTYKLHPETLHLISVIESKYKCTVSVFSPSSVAIAQLTEQQTDTDIFISLAARKECCRQRKVLPLKEALKGKKAWITGQRRSQSTTRSELELQAFDPIHEIEKLNPLVDWSSEDVWAYLKEFEVPYNVLHDQNFPSIGCAPCTRAVAPGEDERSGRWWWENNETKECGLHLIDGKLVRNSKRSAHVD